MKKFDVTITETLKKTVEVEAESLEEAEQRVNDEWRRGEYILDAENFTEVNFDAEEKQPEKLKVVILEPGKIAKEAEIDDTLEAMQLVVGGRIEQLMPFEDEVAIVCNEEGKLIGLPLNRAIYDKDGKMIDIIAGTAFICDCSTERFKSLSDEQIEKYTKQFNLPEKFFRMGDEIKAVPYQPKEKSKER